MLVIVALGIALGIGVGVWLGRVMTQLYAGLFRFPSPTYTLQPWIVWTAAGTALAGALLGALSALRTVAKLVRLHHYGDARPLEGRVRRVEPSAFTKVSALGVEEQRVNVVIDIVSPPAQWQALGDGYRVDARIVVFARDDAVTVPLGAIFRHGNGWAVFVVRDGHARLQPVEAPRRSSTDALVENGVSAGERVVLYPAERVRDGTRVRLLARE